MRCVYCVRKATRVAMGNQKCHVPPTSTPATAAQCVCPSWRGFIASTRRRRRRARRVTSAQVAPRRSNRAQSVVSRQTKAPTIATAAQPVRLLNPVANRRARSVRKPEQRAKMGESPFKKRRGILQARRRSTRIPRFTSASMTSVASSTMTRAVSSATKTRATTVRSAVHATATKERCAAARAASIAGQGSSQCSPCSRWSSLSFWASFTSL